MRANYIIGSVIIVAFLIWGGTSFLESTVQYVPISKASVSTRTVQVIGAVDFETVQYDRENLRLEFVITNPEATDDQQTDKLSVLYHGTVPGNFEQATSVVLKGMPNEDGVFEATQMLVKCPSKYQGEGGEIQDMNKHQGPTTDSL
ncbi:MAG: hypothetical protein DRP45_04655 [Candidatus Zixiibacteriota bacterium]|nr:MAG: hypothetical protein DRP45_04655 [candidate division Zixibacteria bacterium]